MNTVLAPWVVQSFWIIWCSWTLVQFIVTYKAIRNDWWAEYDSLYLVIYFVLTVFWLCSRFVN